MDGEFEERVREQLRHESYHLVFEALVDRFQGKVFRLCCSILADEALAQDASQDVFFSVWRALPQMRFVALTAPGVSKASAVVEPSASRCPFTWWTRR